MSLLLFLSLYCRLIFHCMPNYGVFKRTTDEDLANCNKSVGFCNMEDIWNKYREATLWAHFSSLISNTLLQLLLLLHILLLHVHLKTTEIFRAYFERQSQRFILWHQLLNCFDLLRTVGRALCSQPLHPATSSNTWHNSCQYKDYLTSCCISIKQILILVLITIPHSVLHAHKTPVLHEIQWLLIAVQIQYKLCLLVHKMFVGNATNLLTKASDMPSWLTLQSFNRYTVAQRIRWKTANRVLSTIYLRYSIKQQKTWTMCNNNC